MKKKVAFITGVTGQDGSYLAEFLLEKGYEIYGLVRRSSTFNTERIDHLLKDVHEKNIPLFRFYGDLSDGNSLMSTIKKIESLSGKVPDEIYNLGAQSHVRISFDNPEYTSNIDGLGTLRLLDSIRFMCPNARFYQASSSEMFGKTLETPQNEKTPFNPQSPYACAKVFSHNIVTNYRDSYGMHASNGILFNHESERRGETFVTRKITRALTRMKLGLQDKLFLGNLNAERDWGYSRDYVEAMWLMLQQDKPDDYVIGTGERHSVREFLEKSAKSLDFFMRSNGKNGIEEKYFNKTGKSIVEIDPQYFRPSEVDILLADSSKAKKQLGWKNKIGFDRIIEIMISHDLKLAEEEAYLKKRT